ncbi:hypothetical protein [Caldalkalibacillus mannanilyticus]|uniref:hypothetical protein n=1 Tax=Caldalkalibacillus mannanilyticus TaxID=1418 RepID=UPI0004699D4D|nr:hypothetical protein [Caldalkalibacillus mannanilyticus]
MVHLKKILLLMVILLISISVLSACGSEDSTSDAIGNEVESAVDNTEQKKEKGKNDFNEVELEIIGEKTKKSDYFEITLHSAKIADHIEDYTFDDGELRSAFSGTGKFLIVDASVKSIKIDDGFTKLPHFWITDEEGSTSQAGAVIDDIDDKIQGYRYTEVGQVNEGKFYFVAHDLEKYTLIINNYDSNDTSLSWDFKVKE